MSNEARLHINAAQGLFEVSGSEEFIKALYEDAKMAGLFQARPAQPSPASEVDEPLDEKGEKPKRAVSKRSGPGCPARIADLKSSGFFSELRDPKAIGEALSERGHNYEGKNIAAALSHLTKNGTLRRVKKDGNWMYQQP